MSNPTVAQLQNWFLAAPRDYGWDMMIAYDRTTFNELMVRQFIDGYGQNRNLPLISASLEAAHTSEHFSRMSLRSPRVSFETSELSSSTAVLTMDFIGGMHISAEHSSHRSIITWIREIVPVAAPHLAFDAPLDEMSDGGRDGRGLILDLAKGTGFRANFVLDSLTQLDIGRRFGEVFAGLHDERRTFQLGSLAQSLPVPRSIKLRVMKAPGADNPQSDNHGDGALLLLINTYQASDGTLPTEASGFLYPVAAPLPHTPLSITLMTFQNVLTGARQSDPFPIIMEEYLLDDHLCNYIHALGLGLEHAQMAFYGHVALRDSAFVVDPLTPVVMADAELRFSVKPAATDVKWTLQATDEDGGSIGRISSLGLYEAPFYVVHASRTVVVTAEGRIAGQTRRSSALITILRDSVAVSPLFATCRLGESVDLSAETSPGSQVAEWTLLHPENGGTLSAPVGTACAYTARDTELGVKPFVDVIEVRNPTTSEVKTIHVMVTTNSALVPLFISEYSRPETNRVKLQVYFDKQEMDLVDLPQFALTYHGYTGGEVDWDGVYSAPEDAKGVAILLLTIPDPLFWFVGFLALPLPLWAHADALGRSNQAVRRHCLALAAPSEEDSK
ncbi:hypothetical protein ACX3YG_12850 [Pseudomonas wadenswilerensis]